MHVYRQNFDWNEIKWTVLNCFNITPAPNIRNWYIANRLQNSSQLKTDDRNWIDSKVKYLRQEENS